MVILSVMVVVVVIVIAVAKGPNFLVCSVESNRVIPCQNKEKKVNVKK